MKRTVAMCVLASFALASCGSDSNEIAVEVSEWKVVAPATASAGELVINADNIGGEIHEVVVVRADSVDGFVQDDTGKVDEDGFAEGDFIGEIFEFDAGTKSSGTFDLAAGNYILFCNIVEEEADGTFESHFNEGMVTSLTVS